MSFAKFSIVDLAGAKEQRQVKTKELECWKEEKLIEAFLLLETA